MAVSGHYDAETGLVKISWTKIRVHEECKQKARLVAEGRKSRGADVRIFFPGNVVDMAMRRWLSQENPRKMWMADHVDEIMEEMERKVMDDEGNVVRWKHTEDREQVRKFCVKCSVLLENLLEKIALPYDYHPAMRFSTPMVIPGLEVGSRVKVLLVGEMDLLVREEPSRTGLPYPRLRIWDLKATSDPDYWRKTVAQLVFYDIACWCMFGVASAEAGLLQPMVEGVPYISFTPSDQDRTEMYTRIVKTAHDILRGDDSPKEDTKGCSYCECRNACVRYQPKPGNSTVALF